ncbi:hypothetical protein Pcinc_002765 [Petrolisthes cinctipes]|uniref:Transposase n=1 Tax=Petrolisthes cinctipes TaxID=88211 RepID=A0AAE1GKQ1_PETCI|nr:hypothetical protein Pcinc_002765 [Petrolisthes cinctipes]
MGDNTDHHDSYTRRAQIVGMHVAGRNVSEIARDMGISKPTVRLWLRRHQESGSMRYLPRTGRPRKTTADEDARIVADINNPRHRFTNCVSTRERLHLQISTRTIGRRFLLSRKN